MKTAIITYHFVNNFGGALQACSLCRTVHNLGHDVKILDYRHPFILFTDFVRLFPVSANPKTILSGLLTMRKRFVRVSRYREFMKSCMDLTDTVMTRRGLERLVPGFDTFICGSDQLWNPKITFGICPVYSLSFVPSEKRKIAYAPSFGTYNLPETHFWNVAGLLADFHRISVREEEGSKILEPLTGKSVPRLIDPTFLTTGEDWSKLATKARIHGKFILLYIMQADDSVYAHAKRLKDLLGIKIVEISRYGTKHDFVDEVIVDAGPREFLALFRDAEFVCTNSFHGLCFSLIFNKRFYLVPSRRFSDRLTSQLSIFSLEMFSGKTPEEIIKMHFNWESINAVIAEERRKAIAYLKEGLGA